MRQLGRFAVDLRQTDCPRGGYALRALVLISFSWLAACDSGGGDDNGGGGGGTGNRAPTATAGADQTVPELTAVTLSGAGSDPDAGDTLTYAWTQTAGTAVTINNANSQIADFTAPDVPAGMPETLTFRLTVSDGQLSSTDDINVIVQEPAAVVTISGTLQYEFPTPNVACNGLDFNNLQVRPIRQATVQLLDGTGTNVLETTVSNDNGGYSMNVNGNTDVILRVRAESIRGGNPSWNVEVRDNVVDPADPNPPALQNRPLYVLDSGVFSSGNVDQTRDMTATTGWGGSSFTGPRSAAPFSVLDAIYSGMIAVTAEDPAVNFPPLDAFWSPNNTTTRGTGDFNSRIDSGEIGTSFYTSDMLFLLGMDGDDIEEFDDHVIVHEWGHFFEDNLSRSDSIGGAHGVGDLLDMRVAFGEGFATALSGIALDNPSYCDTLWFGGQLVGFEINAENEIAGQPDAIGWYNEISVVKLIYDMWDTDNDGADDNSIGFGPIYDVMTGPQAVTPAFTSIFTFASALKAQNPADAAFIDTLLVQENIVADTIEPYGSTETDDGPGTPLDVLPIYTQIATDGTPVNICANSQFDSGRTGNKLSEHRYLRFSLASAQQLQFSMTANPAPSTPSVGFNCTANPNDPENHAHSDPDFFVWQNGTLRWLGNGCTPNVEAPGPSPVLPAGDYVVSLQEFRHEDTDPDVPAGFPEQVCFDFTISP